MMSLRNRAPVHRAVSSDQENVGMQAKLKQSKQPVAANPDPARRNVLGDIRNKIAGTGAVQQKKGAVADNDSKMSIKNTSGMGNAAPVDPRRPMRAAIVDRKPPSSNAPSFSTRGSSVMVKSVQDGAQGIRRVTSVKQQTTAVNVVISQKQQTAATSAISQKSAAAHDKHENMELCQQEIAYSASILPAHNNIDEGDERNPLLVAEYVNEIYDYLRQLEIDQAIRENYLEGQQISSRMRAILVDWLAQVHSRFSLLPETLYMAVMLLDRYLQATTTTKDKLQLVGVTAMFVASKYEEIYAPEIADFVYITDNAYQKKDIRLMEIKLLKALDFNLGRPLPIHFLRRFSKAAEADARIHSIAKYLMELSLVEYTMVAIAPSMLAAAALYISLYLENNKPTWNDTLIFYTKYTPAKLSFCVQRMAKVAVKAHWESAKQAAIRKKYETQKFMGIALLPYFTGPIIRKLAVDGTP